VVELIARGMTLAEIFAAQTLAHLDPEWGVGFVKSRLFATIICQSETGDWVRPENILLAE
jgi:hypothetical protein